MAKSKKWYKGNAGLVAGRSKLEATRAGEHNPHNKAVSCNSCGRETTNTNMLCNGCN